MEEVHLHPIYRILKVDYADLLELAADEDCTILLPDIRNTKHDPFNENFLKTHIIKETGEAFLENTWVDINQDRVTLLDCPGYYPSYRIGLYSAAILRSIPSNNSCSPCRILLLDRPVLPASMGNRQGGQRKVEERPKRRLQRQKGLDYGLQHPGSPRTKDGSPRPSHSRASDVDCVSSVRTTSTTLTVPDSQCVLVDVDTEQVTDGQTDQLHIQGTCVESPIAGTSGTSGRPGRSGSTPPRQTSEDSGIEPDSEDFFNLIPKISSYCESESFILSQPFSSQFINHLRRSIFPLRRYIEELSCKGSVSEDQLKTLSTKVQRFCQDSVICFPKSMAAANKSPRFHETLKISVENVVLYFLQDVLWPLLTNLYEDEDIRLYKVLNSLYRSGVGAGELGLRADLHVPLPAAVVELSALDQSSTPLDRLTTIHDSLALVHSHIRECIQKTSLFDGWISYPTQKEELLLFSSIIIKSRCRHLMSTIRFIDMFGFSAQPFLKESLDTMKQALTVIRNFSFGSINTSRLPDLRLEELVRIADKLDRRHSGEVEQVANPVQQWQMTELINRLQRCSMELTKTQEEQWKKLEKMNTEEKVEKNLLTLLHHKLLCNTTILDNG